jgi:hypothetical protein
MLCGFVVKVRLLAIAGLFASLLATEAGAVDLRLRCEGMAGRLETQTTVGSVSGDLDLNGSMTSYRTAQQQDRLLIEINDEGGRIRPPVVMLPPVKGGGLGDGWWKLEKLSVGDTEITGLFKLNVLNNPIVRIDRTTGDIEVNGYMYTRFNGRCEVANSAERRF